MKLVSVELPEEIAAVLHNVPAAKRGEFLQQHGFVLPEKRKQRNSNGKKVLLYTDGASRGNPGEAGAGFWICDAAGNEMFAGKKYLGQMTNNSAEWTALLLGLEKAKEMGVAEVDCFLDSELVVKQMKREYKVKHPDLRPLFEQVNVVCSFFQKVLFTHIPREKNVEADRLSNEAIDEIR